jgi:Beta-propeller repeat/Abnormal spindle-like microcephaly-assoc'd, ASPM-SPD-2-Hydin
MLRNNLLRLLVFLPAVCFVISAQQPTSVTPSGIGSVPVVFEPNLGQVSTDAAFVAHAGYPVSLQSDRLVLILPNGHSAKTGPQNPDRLMTLQFINSSLTARSEGVDRLPGVSNYYIGANPTNWRTEIPQYRAVKFKSIYPGVDLVYHGEGGRLEYDLVLAPAAAPSTIQFKITGADRVALDSSGNIELLAARATLELQKPIIYQSTEDGLKKPVTGKFVINGNTVSLRIGNYRKDRELVIDPVLNYSTLIGSNSSTTVAAVAADASGDMYITGTTNATNYPVVNAFQSQNRGQTNIFVTKLNPAGNVILYSTYLGGGGWDNASGIAVDTSGSAYVTGTATSTNFPTTAGSFMMSCPDTIGICQTGFVTKFLASGALAFSTYMGGTASSKAIAVDSAGEAYIAGTSSVDDLPTTPGSFEPTFPGPGCYCNYAYVEKLNASGSSLVYSTYFGLPATAGTLVNSYGNGIAVDSSGSAYLVGNTTGIPVKNPIQESYVGGGSGVSNAYITKFSPDGSSLEYSTYLGGASLYFFGEAGDFATSVAVDPLGNAHVAGTSSSCDFPLTFKALTTTCVNDEYDQKIFALVLNSSGSQLLFSTFLASGNTPTIATDSRGDSYVAGNTTSAQFPLLHPIESTSQLSNSTAFVSVMDLSGKLLFSTYYGSTYGAVSNGIAVDGKGGVYIAGEGQGDFPLLNPIPSQVLQSTYYTIFASKISANNGPEISLSPRVSPILALRNVSSSPLVISSIVPSANFTMGGNCGSTLAPGTGCTLILVGAKDGRTKGTVTLSTSAHGAPQTFAIAKSPSGDADVDAFLSTFPTTLWFGPQYIGATSAAQTVTLQNAGTRAASITSIDIAQPFNQTNDCPALLRPSASCTISVTYQAATTYDYGSLSITLAQYSPMTVPVYAYGASSSIVLSSSWTPIQFGNQTVGAPGVARIINVVNTTSVPTSAPRITVSSGFSQSNNCSGTLSPGAACKVSIAFLPSPNQNANGTLTVNSFGPGGPQTASLLGTGVASGDLELSPVTLTFAGYVNESQNQTVTVTNNSQNAVPITKVTTAAPFSQSNSCPPTLAAAATCQITVAWDPTQTGTTNGTLQVAYTGTGSPQTIQLSGAAQSWVQFYPTTTQFGSQLVKTSSSMYVGLDNYSSATVNLSAITVQGAAYSISSSTCGTTLSRNTGCSVQVVFTPPTTGLQTGLLSVTVNNSSTPVTGALQGAGISYGAESLSPTSLDFGVQAVGTHSTPQYLTLSNTGTGALTISSISVTPSFFGQKNNCHPSLPAGASCTIGVEFSPTLKGMLVGTLTVQSDGAGSQQTATLEGTGQ